MTSRKTFLRQEMRHYLRSVPDATPEEIADLKEWVEAGNDPYRASGSHCGYFGYPSK